MGRIKEFCQFQWKIVVLYSFERIVAIFTFATDDKFKKYICKAVDTGEGGHTHPDKLYVYYFILQIRLEGIENPKFGSSTFQCVLTALIWGYKCLSVLKKTCGVTLNE